jgi:hypothetical protein
LAYWRTLVTPQPRPARETGKRLIVATAHESPQITGSSILGDVQPYPVSARCSAARTLENTMCSHLAKFSARDRERVLPSSHGCKECLESGDSWVHLRLCLTCGHVGCCDDSLNHHATRHFHATRHPVIKSFEPGEDWAWCFVDGEMIESIATFDAESPSRHYEPPSDVPR